MNSPGKKRPKITLSFMKPEVVGEAKRIIPEKKSAIIGITGGFLSGKTSLLNLFKASGAETLNIDEIYSEILFKKKRLRDELVKIFGKDVKRGERIDKKKVLNKLIRNKRLFSELNRVTHPQIIKELKTRISFYRKKKKSLVIEVPLLYEKGLAYLFDKVVVVYVPFKVQLERARLRGYTKTEALTFIRGQMSLREKIKLADYVIENSRTKKFLKREFSKLLTYLNRFYILS